MHIKEIKITNFRLLKDVKISLEKQTTVIVGRNNSGKTSLTEFFRRLISDGPASFKLEDFSLQAQHGFWDAFVRASQGGEDDEIREMLPTIDAEVVIEYNKEASDLSTLSEFIIDLDVDSNKAIAKVCYRLKDGNINSLFDNITYLHDGDMAKQKRDFFRSIKDRIPQYYILSLLAVDPTNENNTKPIELSKLRLLLQTGFINAQRGLDDTTLKEKDVLGKILENLLKAASSEMAATADHSTAIALEGAVQGIQNSIDKDFNEQLNNLLPAFSLFGYPGLSDPNLCTETILDVQRLLENNTKIRYANSSGISLPESYNGLGSRNLIFILLQLLEFFKAYKAKPTAPNVHLVFIEEPEAHLHPQMQEVFIRKISEIAKVFSEIYNDGQPWPVQFVVTTHSTHMANQAPFEAIRYFMASKGENQFTKIKDLRNGLSGESWDTNRGFLHKYLTLTRCDLFFADKAMLIEGSAERLLMPNFIEKIDSELTEELKLSCQYISVVEVGGAYAHNFLRLLDFLELKTLIITDLDSVKLGDTNRRKACKVSEGQYTSNACIKAWFDSPDIAPSALISKENDEKEKGLVRIAYQVPENGLIVCGRSFEDAFMLANRSLFSINDIPEQEAVDIAWDEVQNIGKTDFALTYALDQTAWSVPKYISEGLKWLAQNTAMDEVIEEEVDNV